VTSDLTNRLADAGSAQIAQQDQRLAELGERVAGLLQQLEATGDLLNQKVAEADARVNERVESAAREIEEKARQRDEILGEHREQLQATVAEAKSALDHHVSEHIAGTQSQLHGATDAAVAEAQQRLQSSLEEHSSRMLSAVSDEIKTAAERQAA